MACSWVPLGRLFGQGETPLLRASEEDEVEVVELLLKSGASVEVKNNKGGGPQGIPEPRMVELWQPRGRVASSM